jgi:hypothetical protein
MDHGATGAIHEIVHWVAAVVLVVGGAVVVGLAARARAVERAQVGARAFEPGSTAEPGGDRSPLVILAGLSFGAAAIHLAAAPSHYVELGDLGAGFLAAALLQAAWARSVLRGATPRTIVAGIAINTAIVAAWAFTRTVGLPVGPSPFVAEPVGLPDGASTVFELALLAGLAAVAMARRRPSLLVTARPLVTIATVPILGLVILISSFATVAIVAGADHGGMPVGGAHAAMENASTR